MRNFRIRLISLLTSVVILLSSAPINIVSNAVWVEGNVVIRIHYLVEGGAKIFNDYSVSLKSGDDYSAEVPSPTFSGYEPFTKSESGEYVSAKTVTLHYENLTKDKDVDVVYRPAKSPYTVRYFLQNVKNDEYTEKGSMTIRGEALTGEYPKTDAEINIDGFTPLFHEPDKVAADGSTEFLVYYDRNYYSYTFDCAGGYGTNSVYARYGTNLVVPNPTRHGYVFQGWDLEVDGVYDGEVDKLPATVGSQNVKYKAVWLAEPTTARVVYWIEDPDDPTKYNYLAEQEVIRNSGHKIQYDVLEKNGRLVPPEVDISHYELDVERTKQSVLDTPTVEGDGSTIVNVYYKRKQYTLKFFYARSKVENDEKIYQVVGGSSYGFALKNSADDSSLLDNVEKYNSGTWGQVASLPEYDKEKYSGVYTEGDVTYGDYTYYYISFVARYGEKIDHEWPFGSMDAPVFKSVDIVGTHDQWTGNKAIFSGWTPEHHIKFCCDERKAAVAAGKYEGQGNYTVKGDYTRFDDSLLYDSEYKDQATDEISFLAFWENGSNIGWSIPRLFVYNLYVEKLRDTDDIPGQTYVDYNGKRYRLYKSYGTCDNSTVQEQTATPLLGFTNIGKEDGGTPEFDSTIYNSGHIVNFFYSRNEYKLTKRRYDNKVYKETYVQYGAPLMDYLDPPTYPDTLEKGAYTFGDWYHSPVRISPMDENSVMPANDMSMYAKWTPVSHKVTFSKTIEDLQSGNHITINGDESFVMVEHNSLTATANIPNVEWSGHEFEGWFYLDRDGVIHAFDPHTMIVTEDMDLFGQWQSPVIAKYTVHYVSEGEKIADNTEGHTFVANTKTFQAKSGDDLYQSYQEGYFPKVNSRSIVIKPDENDNELTIEYVNISEVNYTVRYLDSATGEKIADPFTESTSHSVVTAQFKPIDGYVADAYYKRLVLTADEAQNVLTFYYVKTEDGDEKLNYAVKHFIQDLDGENYTEYSSEDLIGKKGEEITVDPLSITGFGYSVAVTQEQNSSVNGINVSESGVSWTLSESVVVNIYYTRNDAYVQIHFVEYGNQENVLKDIEELKGKYEETRSYTAYDSITKENIKYTIVGSATRDITFRQGLDGRTHIYFYYQSKTILINYQAVCRYPNMIGGKVSHMSEMVSSGANVVGCEPIANPGFVFAGWFEDKDCTKSVDPNWLKAGDKIVPRPADSATYYALFEPDAKAPITITKSGVEESDQNQSFLFEIKAKDGTVDLIVSITGNGTVTVNDLPLGDYTVTEITDWSWRYELKGDNGKAVKLTKDGGVVAFENQRNSKKWLGGEAQKDNHFDKITV